MSAKPVFAIVHPMRQIDDLQMLNHRIEALIEASYDLFEELHDAGCLMKDAAAAPITRAAGRGMILLGLVRELIDQSQTGLSQEYSQLAQLGVHKMEKAA